MLLFVLVLATAPRPTIAVVVLAEGGIDSERVRDAARAELDASGALPSSSNPRLDSDCLLNPACIADAAMTSDADAWLALTVTRAGPIAEVHVRLFDGVDGSVLLAEELTLPARQLSAGRGLREAVARGVAAARARMVERAGRMTEPQMPPLVAASREPETELETPLAPWIVVGASAAVAAGGGVLLFMGRADANAVDDAPDGADWRAYSERYERASSRSLTGAILLGVGLAGAAGGLVWRWSTGQNGAVAVVPVGTGIGLAATY